MSLSNSNESFEFKPFANNACEFSVREFSRAVKNLLEDSFGYVRIRGEVVASKLASSGHFYFNLKEEEASLAAVCFRNQFLKIDFEIADGLQVVAIGKISTFEGRSNYQIIVEKLEIAGLGAILEMLQKRKTKLQAEGLFDEIHKKPLPFLPKKIGIITSATGAVIEDIKNRIADRFPTHLLLYQAQMQGKNSAQQVIQALKYFNRLGKDRPDVVIIARGGGSFEDLLPFSDENLVREAFKSQIPIISAIGHETDNCLLDLVADLRAATPTAAAEIATPVMSELKNSLKNHEFQIRNSIRNSLQQKTKQLAVVQKMLINPEKYVENCHQQVLQKFSQIQFLSKNRLDLEVQKLKNFHLNPLIFIQKFEFLTRKLCDLSLAIKTKIAADLQHKKLKIDSLAMVLIANSHHEILRKGFAIIRSKEGKLLNLVKDAKNADKINIEMSDGSFEAIPKDEKLPSLFD